MLKKHTIFYKITALLLVLVFLFPITVQATESRASYYLDSYSAYVYPAGWYKVQVWVSVHGVDYMDEIGALTIQLYESKDQETWTWVDTFHYTDYPDMLGYNDYYHSGHVEYAGTIGRYYKAYVSIWAGKDGNGDNRQFWTIPQKATLFAGAN